MSFQDESLLQVEANERMEPASEMRDVKHRKLTVIVAPAWWIIGFTYTIKPCFCALSAVLK